MTLTGFLLARITEDEDLAERIEANPERPRGPQYVSGVGRVAVVGSGYLLAECEAKRRIIQQCERLSEKRLDGSWHIDEDWEILFALATTYADHPDFDESWRG